MLESSKVSCTVFVKPYCTQIDRSERRYAITNATGKGSWKSTLRLMPSPVFMRMYLVMRSPITDMYRWLGRAWLDSHQMQ